jgi:hypothetical protein
MTNLILGVLALIGGIIMLGLGLLVLIEYIISKIK